MSSRPPDHSGRRPEWIVWLRRRWLVVWAWRLLVAGYVQDPKRDPAVRAAVLAGPRGKSCSVCGLKRSAQPAPLVAARFEVDHRRPLWASGKDEPGNCDVKCSVCHLVKSKGEAPVRAVVKRWHRRLAVLRTRPRPVVAVFGVLFLAGIVTTRWVVVSVLLLLALLFGARLIEGYLVPAPFRRRVRLGGLDGMTYWQKRDSEREQNIGGIVGDNAKVIYGGRMKMIAAKLAIIDATVVYLAGVYVRHFGDETVVLMVRLLI